jgi:hypothetical protein
LPLNNSEKKLSEVVSFATEKLFHKNNVVCEVAVGSKSNMQPVTLGDLCSGALVHSVVQQAISIAIERDIQSCKRRQKPKASGINDSDLSKSVEYLLNYNRVISHEDAIRGLEKFDGQKLVGMRPVKPTGAVVGQK